MSNQPKSAPTAEEQPDVTKNIHGEVLPEGYRFSGADEARLDALDFYSHKGAFDNPPTDVTEADRFMAWRWYGQFLDPMRDDWLRSMAWRISRESQLLAALRSNREKDAQLVDLRGALIASGRAAGCLLADEVSTGFIVRGVPGEVQAKIALQERQVSTLLGTLNSTDASRQRIGEERDELRAQLAEKDAKIAELEGKAGPERLRSRILGVVDGFRAAGD